MARKKKIIPEELQSIIDEVNGTKLIYVELNLEDAGLVKQIADNLQNKHIF